ncbi:hypothetical protein [Petrocella sp. FN5]|uniref:hypothetical protein n=1 Tax=Petrocella sp. FN5 TaxID=3032002 RepID=UPI0023D9D1FE|nr:hypothetical protein [Petrocella sp. FN5]MDF1617307.1 hypothetical protein [Petrocella sp. FN5]
MNEFGKKNYKNIRIFIYRQLLMIPVLVASITLGGIVLDTLLVYETTLLKRAQTAYFDNDINKAVEYYMKNEKSDIALNNLGYIYSKRMEFDSHITIAKEFYQRSAKLGNEAALENLVCIYREDGFSTEEVIEIFNLAYRIGNSKILELLKEILAHENVLIEIGNISDDEYYFLSNNEKKAIFEDLAITTMMNLVTVRYDYGETEINQKGEVEIYETVDEIKQPREIEKRIIEILTDENFKHERYIKLYMN